MLRLGYRAPRLATTAGFEAGDASPARSSVPAGLLGPPPGPLASATTRQSQQAPSRHVALPTICPGVATPSTRVAKRPDIPADSDTRLPPSYQPHRPSQHPSAPNCPAAFQTRISGFTQSAFEEFGPLGEDLGVSTQW